MRVRCDSASEFLLRQAAIAAKLTPSVYKCVQSASPSRLLAANQTLIPQNQTRQPELILFFPARARPRNRGQDHTASKHAFCSLGKCPPPEPVRIGAHRPLFG